MGRSFYRYRGIKVNPKFDEVYATMGISYVCLGRFDEAVQTCQKAIQINPKLSEASNTLGIAYHGLGRQGDASEAFRRALMIEPEFDEARKNLEQSEDAVD